MSSSPIQGQTPLDAVSWNGFQEGLREALHTHHHSEHTLTGAALASTAQLSLGEARVQDLIVGGQSVRGLCNSRLPASGGTVASLRVSGDLTLAHAPVLPAGTQPYAPPVLWARYDSNKHGAIPRSAVKDNTNNSSYSGCVIGSPAYLSWVPIPRLALPLGLKAPRVVLVQADIWVSRRTPEGLQFNARGYPVFVQPFVTFDDSPEEHIGAEALAYMDDPSQRANWSGLSSRVAQEGGLLVPGGVDQDIDYRPRHSTLLLALPLPAAALTVSLRAGGSAYSVCAATLTLTLFPP